jgi:site-specific DNA-cytosine methylase
MAEYKIYMIPHGYYGGGWFDKYAPSITTSSYEFNNYLIEIEMETEKKEKKQIQLPPELQGKKFRIRKLTPMECFRLMGVDDADIDKMQASGLSNSAQYKLAGNSIVVDVLYHIFRKMFIDTGQENQQLTLF